MTGSREPCAAEGKQERRGGLGSAWMRCVGYRCTTHMQFCAKGTRTSDGGAASVQDQGKVKIARGAIQKPKRTRTRLCSAFEEDPARL